MRVTGNQEPRRKGLHQYDTDAARRIIHRITTQIPKEIVRSKPREEWAAAQDQINSAAEEWTVRATAAWWAAEETRVDSTRLTAVINTARGADTWAAENRDQIIEETDIIVQKWIELKGKTLRLEVRKGTAKRYLGVWFEGGGKWQILVKGAVQNSANT